MAKFTALQPISNAILEGIGLFSNPRGVRFEDIERDGFIAQSNNARLEVEGRGFKGALGRPKAEGTVTDIKFFSQGTPIYKLKDAKYSFHKLADSSNTAKHTSKIFAKDDVINGSFGNDILYGFGGNDRINGKTGNDTLYGGGGRDVLTGGDGFDTLDGGNGKDTYVFKSDPITGYDTIVKFQKGEAIHLKAKFFAGLEVGELTQEQFVIGAAAQDADDRIIYNSATGILSHDPDGAGGIAQITFARVQAGLNHLTEDSFLII